MSVIAAIIGRILLAALFIIDGASRLFDPAAAAQAIEAQTSFSGSLAVPIGIFEVIAGLILASGFMTRITAIVLAIFTALITLFFHNQVTDPMQGAIALRNLAVIGGLLMVFAYGQVRGSLSTWRERDKRHDAEVRAARAEGKAEGAAAHVHDTHVVGEPRVIDRDRDGRPG